MARPTRRCAAVVLPLVLAFALFVPTTHGEAGGTNRPFKFSATGTADLNLATLQNSIALTARGTHLGLFHQTELAQLAPIGPGVLSFNSVWTATAANGDQSFGTCSGQSTTPDGGAHVLVSLDCLVTAGTGRFEGGSGSFHVTVNATRVSIEPGHFHFTTDVTGEGTISY